MYKTRLRNKKRTNKKNKQENTNTTMEANKSTQNTQIPFTTPAQKRLREVMQTSLVENISKSPRLAITESPIKFIQTMDKRFDKLTEQLTDHLQTIMQKMLHECKESLLSEIDKKFNILMSDMNKVTERVTNLESFVVEIKNTATSEMIALKNETEKLKNEIAYLKTFARKQENSIVAYDIRITNVPTEPNENLYDIYYKLCDTVKIPPHKIKSIFRVKINKDNHRDSKRNNNKKTSDAAIIVKFNCPYERNFVLKSITSYVKYRKDTLRLNLIGYDSSVPFFVHENLTPENHRIFIKAHRLKRDKRISAAFTNRGLVYIRQHGNEEPICIKDVDTLNQLFPPQGPDNNGSIHSVHDTMLYESSDRL